MVTIKVKCTRFRFLQLFLLFVLLLLSLLFQGELLELQVAHPVAVVVRHGEPRMLQHSLGGWPVTRVPPQHWQEEVRKHVCFMLLEAVLVGEEPLEREVAQLVDVLEDEFVGDRVALEEFLEERAGDCVVLRHGTEELNHLGKVVVGLAVVLSFAWVEQEVAGDEFEDHASERP